MKSAPKFDSIEKLIIQDKRLSFTVVSYAMVFLIFLNLNLTNLTMLGIIASLVYFLINGIFLGHVFFDKESPFLRSMLGVLLFIMLLSFTGWLVLIIYNLDMMRFTLVLFIAATFSSLLNKKVKSKHAA